MEGRQIWDAKHKRVRITGVVDEIWVSSLWEGKFPTDAMKAYGERIYGSTHS
jgi:hypothetical protein